MRKIFWLALLTMILMATVGLGVAKARVVGIAGKGTGGGFEVQVSATQLPNGSAKGNLRVTGGATGPVVQVVPPSGVVDWWCINAQRTDTSPAEGDQRINLYIRDVGDGKTTFDQIQLTSGIAVNCTTFPAPGGPFLTLTEGDYKAHGL